MGWRYRPCAFICFPPALVGAQAFGNPTRLQPDLVPLLGAKAGATKLVCQGHHWHLDRPPHAHPGGAAPLPGLGVFPCSLLTQTYVCGAVGGSPEHLVQTQCLFALILERLVLSIHPRSSLFIALLLHSYACIPRRCWPPGAWGPSSGSSQQPMQMRATPCY